MVRNNRKNLTIHVNNKLQVVVRVPIKTKDREIKALLERYDGWIKESLIKMKAQIDSMQGLTKLSPAEIIKLKKELMPMIKSRVEHFAEVIGVQPGKITIGAQKTLYGSCSPVGNLSFNCALAMMPPEVVDYVVIHELCHLLERNHSKVFWDIVEGYCPEYKTHKKWLKQNGGKILYRLIP